jgi:hypothetical protein
MLVDQAIGLHSTSISLQDFPIHHLHTHALAVVPRIRLQSYPWNFLKSQLDGMNQTIREDGSLYWHIQIHNEGERWVLHRRKEYDWPDITSMMLVNIQGAA